MTTDQLVTLVTTQGFAVVVALWFMFRLEALMSKLTDSVNAHTVATIANTEATAHAHQ